jgi:hypothetical protein
MRTYVDPRNGITFRFDPKEKTVTATDNTGYEAVEVVSPSLVERLTKQIGEPFTKLLLKSR